MFHGRDKQTDEIGHEHLGMHIYMVFLRCVEQPVRLCFYIVVAGDTTLSVVTSLNHVLRNASQASLGLLGIEFIHDLSYLDELK